MWLVTSGCATLFHDLFSRGERSFMEYTWYSVMKLFDGLSHNLDAVCRNQEVVNCSKLTGTIVCKNIFNGSKQHELHGTLCTH